MSEAESNMDLEFVFTPTRLDSVQVLEKEEGVAEQVRVQVEGSAMAVGTFLVDALTTMECKRYNVSEPDQQESMRNQRQHDIEMALEDGTLIDGLTDNGITFGDIRVSARKVKGSDNTFILKFGNNGGDKPLKSEWIPQE